MSIFLVSLGIFGSLLLPSVGLTHLVALPTHLFSNPWVGVSLFLASAILMSLLVSSVVCHWDNGRYLVFGALVANFCLAAFTAQGHLPTSLDDCLIKTQHVC